MGGSEGWRYLCRVWRLPTLRAWRLPTLLSVATEPVPLFVRDAAWNPGLKCGLDMIVCVCVKRAGRRRVQRVCGSEVLRDAGQRVWRDMDGGMRQNKYNWACRGVDGAWGVGGTCVPFAWQEGVTARIVISWRRFFDIVALLVRSR